MLCPLSIAITFHHSWRGPSPYRAWIHFGSQSKVTWLGQKLVIHMSASSVILEGRAAALPPLPAQPLLCTHIHTSTWSTILLLTSLVPTQCLSDYCVPKRDPLSFYPLHSFVHLFIHSTNNYCLLLPNTNIKKTDSIKSLFMSQGIYKNDLKVLALPPGKFLLELLQKEVHCHSCSRNPAHECNLCVGSLQWQFSKLPRTSITKSSCALKQ